MREAFPDFKLVFTNKGEKIVRLFDDFYPLKDDGPNIHIEIWRKANGERKGPLAWYSPMYKIERVGALMRLITLKPGEKYEVPVKEAYLLLVYLEHLRNRESYELEVRFHDGYGESGVQTDYVGKADFETVSRAPKGVYSP